MELAPDLVASRHDWLLDRIAAERRITTNSAADELGVSVDTIRRDLRTLHDRGLLRRVHGGAVGVSPLSPSFVGRAEDDSPERIRLADAVIAQLRPGQLVGLDAGTTTAEIAARLPRSLEITIVTNNPAAALALADHPTASVIMVGGDIDLRWMAVTGTAAVDTIRDHNLDLAVVGVCSFDPSAGGTTRSQLEVPTKRALVGAAAETIVPLESDKLGTVAPFKVIGPTDARILVVRDAADPDVLERCRTAGVDVTSV